MTPKEKAQQLIDKFYEFTDGAYYDDAKQCALIACENEYKSLREMLFNLKASKVIESDSVYLSYIQNLIEEEKEVKTEIEKL